MNRAPHQRYQVTSKDSHQTPMSPWKIAHLKTWVRPIQPLAVLLLIASVLTGSAFAAGKIAPDMPIGAPGAMVDVIVRFKNPLTQATLQQRGGYGPLLKQFSMIQSVHAKVPLGLLPF